MAETSKSAQFLQIYFVGATLLGLVLIVIGSITLINLGLTQTVFKNQPFTPSPPSPYVDVKAIEENRVLSDEEKKSLQQWSQDYQTWQETEAKRDYEADNRRSGMAMGVSVLATGLPIFALHAPVIFRRMKRDL